MSYLEKVQDIVKELLEEHVDDIVEQYLEEFRAEESADHYDESYIHESLDTGDRGLKECAEILEELSEYEVDDEGLWEGRKPVQAIESMAFFTMRNAAESKFREAVAEINGLDWMEDLYQDYIAVENEELTEDEKEEKKEEIRDNMKQDLEKYIQEELF